MVYKTIHVVKIKLVRDKTIEYNAPIKDAKTFVSILTPFFEDLDREKFVVVGLNSANYPTVINIVSLGCINSTHVNAVDVFKPLVLSNSFAFICAHNQPSGELEPSQADINITARLKEVGELIGFAMLDHLIVNDADHFYSFKEHNHI